MNYDDIKKMIHDAIDDHLNEIYENADDNVFDYHVNRIRYYMDILKKYSKIVPSEQEEQDLSL